MRITWKSHPYDSTKNGITEHVSREMAAVAVGFNQAAYAPYKNYVEALSDHEKQRSQAPPPAVEWGIKPRDGSAFSVNVVLKRVGNDTTYYSAPPPDAPPSIVAKFNELASANPNAAAEALEKAKREQATYNEESKTWLRY